MPAAFEAVPHEGNAARVEARIAVDGANGPTSPAAELIPADAGVLVVPDILANASGVIVSHFEWMQANQAYWWDEGEVEMCRAKRMNSARHRVLGHSIERGVTRRTAATVLAVERVVQAHRLRGLYP